MKRRREAGPLLQKGMAGQKGTPSEGILSGSASLGGGSAGSTPKQQRGPGSPGQGIAVRPMYHPPNVLYDASSAAYHPSGPGQHADPERVSAMIAAVKADAQRSLSRRLPSSHPIDDEEDKPGWLA